MFALAIIRMSDYNYDNKIGYMWLIPKDAEKPVDARRKEFKHE